MLRKLRRGSKASTEDDMGRTDSSPPALQHATHSEGRLSFFALPAELRNAIYELVIADATLSLPSNIFATSLSRKAKLGLKRKKPLIAPNINGLLLASKLCRQEYLSVLLSTISVVVSVQDFYFDNLIRVSTSLSDFEVHALQSNRNLTLHLDTRNCTAKDMAALRRWLQFRTQDEQPLPWQYKFPMETRLPPSNMGKVRLVRELEYYADSIAALVDITVAEHAELMAIIKAFESEAAELEEALGWHGQGSKSVSRNIRGLAGGGLL